MTTATKNLPVRVYLTEGNKFIVDLNTLGDSGTRALKKIEQATEPASRGLKVIDAVATEVKGSVTGLAERSGPLASILGALGPVGIAAGAALATVGLGIKKGVEEVAEAEKSYHRLEAVLRATGNSAGLTASDIAAAAQKIERSTAATAEQVQDAAGVLAAFNAVTGENFTRTLGLAQDVVSVFGGDLSSRAQQLGKALSEPAEGLEALIKVGVRFSAEQKALIQSLVETGQRAAAQKLILDAVTASVGGAGAAEQQGLTGASKRLSDAWGDLTENFARFSGVADATQRAVDNIANSVRKMADSLDENNPATKMKALQEELVSAVSNPAYLNRNKNDIAKDIILLQQKMDMEQREKELLAETTDEANDRADVANRAAITRNKLQEQYNRLLNDPASRIKAINEELQKTTASINAAVSKGAISQQLGKQDLQLAQENARLQIEAIEKPAREAAQRVAEANAKVISDLTTQFANIGDKRQAAIDQALGRLSKGATDEQRREVSRLAGALYDQTRAQDLLNKSQTEAARIVEKYRNPLSVIAEEQAKVNELYRQGKLDVDSYAQAMQQLYDRELAQRTDAAAGTERALTSIHKKAADSATAVENAFNKAYDGMTKGLAGFLSGSEKGFDSLRATANSVAEDILERWIGNNITTPIADFFGSTDFFPSLLAGVHHTGGTAGQPQSTRAVPAHVFNGAARYHSGGIAGLRPNEVPAILEKGEEVLPRGAARAPTRLEVKVYNQAGVDVDVRQQPGGESVEIYLRKQVKGMIDAGAFDSSMRTRYGASPRTTGR